MKRSMQETTRTSGIWFTIPIGFIIACILVWTTICVPAFAAPGKSDSAKGVIDTPSGKSTDPVQFPTFQYTGNGICTDAQGKPVIIMFSLSTCPHCEWGGPIFDTIVRYYISEGKIVAHHYDVKSGDDLLTKKVEKKIPERYYKIWLHNSGGRVPYYYFGCEYDRIGNGYQKKDDIAAEGKEMTEVIEALIREAKAKGKYRASKTTH